FPLGTATVTCTAADTAGNTATATFTVRVVDTTAPVVTVPDDQTVEATGPAGATAAWTTATAHAIVSRHVPVTCHHAPGTGFPLGVTTAPCRAADAAGTEGRAA